VVYELDEVLAGVMEFGLHRSVGTLDAEACDGGTFVAPNAEAGKGHPEGSSGCGRDGVNDLVNDDVFAKAP
jgi:hypothetical protein